MRQLQLFGRFWYDFLVGDDVTIAVGIVVVMAATALLTANGQNAWWLLLAGVFVPLIVSVLRAADHEPGAMGGATSEGEPAGPEKPLTTKY